MEKADVIDLVQPFPAARGIEVAEIRDRRCNETLRQLVQLGQCMARRLQDYADELARIAGNDSYGARERALVAAWKQQLRTMQRHPPKPCIGYCEGLCGGLLSHDLVDGLCPQCREDDRIKRL